MLRKEEIIRIARINDMKPHQQEKHYLQSHILRSIYSRFDPIFKGGTCLMFLHGLNRFSEDLDFTLRTEIEIQNLMDIVRKDLEYMGIRSNTKMLNEGGTGLSFRIGAEGPLFTQEIETCYARIEISMREKTLLPSDNTIFEPPYPDIMPFTILAMDRREIMAEKFRAIMTRDRARDVYDLWFLIKKGTRTGREDIASKLSYYEKNFVMDEFLRRLEEKNALWEAELKPVVMGKLPAFTSIREDILSDIEKWLV